MIEMLMGEQDGLDLGLIFRGKRAGQAAGVQAQHFVDQKASVLGVEAFHLMGAKDTNVQERNSWVERVGIRLRGYGAKRAYHKNC